MELFMNDKKDNRLQILLSEAELEAIDDWRFEHRLASRNEAMRQLIAIALRKNPKPID